MRAQDHDKKEKDTPGGFWRSRYAFGYLVIGAVAAYFLLSEHLAHVAGLLPYLLLLVCPLMHVFMHHGKHRRHQAKGREQGTKEAGKSK